jgi:hypothetical protein
MCSCCSSGQASESHACCRFLRGAFLPPRCLYIVPACTSRPRLSLPCLQDDTYTESCHQHHIMSTVRSPASPFRFRVAAAKTTDVLTVVVSRVKLTQELDGTAADRTFPRLPPSPHRAFLRADSQSRCLSGYCRPGKRFRTITSSYYCGAHGIIVRPPAHLPEKARCPVLFNSHSSRNAARCRSSGVKCSQAALQVLDLAVPAAKWAHAKVAVQVVYRCDMDLRSTTS